MSLEAKIELLTKAVEALTAQLNIKQIQQPTDNDAKLGVANVEKHFEPVTETTEIKPEVKTGMTREDLQSACLGLVRENPENKAKIKAILAEFGAKIIADIPNDDLSKLEANLGEL